MNGESSLSDTFQSVAKHIFSPTMIIMMAVMAFPAVAMAAPAGAATIGDLGMGLLDHYGTMFTAPFTEAEMIGDVISNTANGEFAASSYEFGSAHGSHGMSHDVAGHGGTEMQHGSSGGSHDGHETHSVAGSEHAGHPVEVDPAATQPFQKSFTNWLFNLEASGQLGMLDGTTDNLVETYKEFSHLEHEH